ncbi:hypothetical protein BYT27DRAFT_7182570 [Phlegmacium glaucopus]|nr:hypothetical protein BYT27DRAFT_7182570 [Phlegmacium glaucopus]
MGIPPWPRPFVDPSQHFPTPQGPLQHMGQQQHHHPFVDPSQHFPTPQGPLQHMGQQQQHHRPNLGLIRFGPRLPLPPHPLPFVDPSQYTPTPQGPLQQMGQYQHHHPNPGPIRHQPHSRYRMTEPSTRHNKIHISSGLIASDHSTGTHLAYARMGANDNTRGVGRARSLSGNPRMVGRSSTHEKQKKPYHRQRSGPSQTQKRRRGKVDPSAHKVPIMEPETSTTAGGSNVPATIPAPIPASASTSAVPMPTAASIPAQPISTPTPVLAEVRQRGLGGKTKRKPKVYDYDSDVHRVSSGSETDSDWQY